MHHHHHHGMVSKGEENNMAIIKEFMRFKVRMEGSVNGHEFEIEGEGEGRPYEGFQTAKLKVTKGGPLPFAWDILSPQFTYGSKAYVKHPADIPDYFKLSFPEGFKWERVMNFEDGGVVTVTQDSSLQDGEFIYKVKLRGTNFPSDGPVMQKKTMGWEASSERMYPEDGALKGEIKMRLKLKDGGHYTSEVKTTYKAKKPVQLPGAYIVGIKLDITSHNEDYTIVEQYERAEGRHSTGGMDELYKGSGSGLEVAVLAESELGSEAQRERRKRILDATMAIASKGGYEAVQMRAVADRADVAVGTLYRYFPSKVHLLVSALGREFSRIDAKTDRSAVAGATPFQRLNFMVGKLNRAMQRNPLLTEAMTRAYVFADASAASEVDQVEKLIDSMFARAMANGEPTEDQYHIARVISDVWLSNLLAWLTRRASATDVSKRLDLAVRLLIGDQDSA